MVGISGFWKSYVSPRDYTPSSHPPSESIPRSYPNIYNLPLSKPRPRAHGVVNQGFLAPTQKVTCNSSTHPASDIWDVSQLEEGR